MIKSLAIKNFAAFEDLDIQFSPAINIIIGENGAGKSQLLKAAYALSSNSNQIRCRADSDAATTQLAFTDRLLRLFMPLDNKLGKLHHQGALTDARLSGNFFNDLDMTLTFKQDDKHISLNEKSYYNINCNAKDGTNKQAPVFIPTKEMLSMMLGFNSLYERYDLSFDQTHQDISLLLDLPKVRSTQLHPTAKLAIEKINQLIGGQFVFHGGGKVTFKTDTSEYSANAMAEGFRKMGMLARLLETGAIQPNLSGPLIWDEPEAGLNPKLMRLLVEILLELARSGQQIILATHDYVLLKWFNLLMDKDKGDSVYFHMLFREQSREQSGEEGHENSTNLIKVDSTDNYHDIHHNAIADAFNDLSKEQVNKNMGTLGK